MTQNSAKLCKSGQNVLLESLNRTLLENLKSYPHQTGKLLEASAYAVDSPGHRWRPILLFTIYNELTQKTNYQEILPLASAIEYLHTASIILDDLPMMDDGTLRRGKIPCHIKYNQARAVHAALWLCDVAQHYIHEFQSQRDISTDLENLLRTIKNDMIHGQTIDLELKNLTLEEIIEKYRLKSGALYGFTASLPAHILGLTEFVCPLESFGNYLGIAYQIADDIHDHTDTIEALGKDVRKDEDKSTIPIICGIEKATELRETYKEKALKELQTIPKLTGDVAYLLQQICL